MKYTPRHSRQHSPMRRLRHCTGFAAAALIIFMLAGAGGTVAFLHAKSDTAVNEFYYADVGCRISENNIMDQNGNVSEKKDVQVQNTGDCDAFIRCAVTAVFCDADGRVFGGHSPVAGYDYNISFLSSGWLKGSDGFYYWKEPVPPSGFTGVLIRSCVPVPEYCPEGCRLSVDILAEAIQSFPAETAADAWNITVGADGSIGAVP